MSTSKKPKTNKAFFAQKSLLWSKMSGAGNSFWITHFLPPTSPMDPAGEADTAPQLVDTNWPDIARKLCQKTKEKGGADGMAVLLPSKTCDFKWLFYNADGSSAEMCGNLACCVTEYVWVKNLVPSDQAFITLETPAGTIKGFFAPSNSLNLAQNSLQQKTPAQHHFRAKVFFKPKEIKGPFTLSFKKETLTYMFINSGVPHAVIKLDSPHSLTSPLPFLESKVSEGPDSQCSKDSASLHAWSSFPVEWENKKKLAQILRKSTKHHKNGMNVSFYAEISPQESSNLLFPIQDERVEKQNFPVFKRRDKKQNVMNLLACSFERGVEDWTLACGTGALAVAQVYLQSHAPKGSEIGNTVLVQMPGGMLQVGFHSDKTLSLMSPVKWHSGSEGRSTGPCSIEQSSQTSIKEIPAEARRTVHTEMTGKKEFCFLMETSSSEGAIGLYSYQAGDKNRVLDIQPIKIHTWKEDHSACLNPAFESFFTPEVAGYDTAGEAHHYQQPTEQQKKGEVFVPHENLKKAFLALGVGPGRFTGTRVGVSFAKSLNFISQVPIYPVSSLKILAESQFELEKPILVLVNAFRNSLYMGLYQKKQGQLREILTPRVVLPRDLPSLIHYKQCVCVGDGYAVYESYLPQSFKKQLEFKNHTFPRIKDLACLLKREFDPSQLVSWRQLSPVYLRSPVSTLK